jgi:hypothetical protein
MVLAGLKFDELNAILKENGFNIESSAYWEKHDIVILKRGDETVPLHTESYYGFPFVVKFLRSLGIKPPEDCEKPYDQWKDQLKNESNP